MCSCQPLRQNHKTCILKPSCYWKLQKGALPIVSSTLWSDVKRIRNSSAPQQHIFYFTKILWVIMRLLRLYLFKGHKIALLSLRSTLRHSKSLEFNWVRIDFSWASPTHKSSAALRQWLLEENLREKRPSKERKLFLIGWLALGFNFKLWGLYRLILLSLPRCHDISAK